jgi:two-component system KDP operon response regulator KdpE
VARVKAVLHRTKFPQEVPQPVFSSEELCIDFAQHQVKITNQEILLPPTEYRILCLLARNAGRVITHEQLLTEVWGREYRGDTHILQVAVARLRKRLGDDPGNPRFIATRPGIGYTFKKPRGEDSPNGTVACGTSQQAQD